MAADEYSLSPHRVPNSLWFSYDNADNIDKLYKLMDSASEYPSVAYDQRS